MRVQVAAVAVVVLLATAVGADGDSPWSEAPGLRGPHEATYQRTTSEVLPNGKTVLRTNSFKSIGTGMHAWDGAAWVPADERLELVPGGASGQHTAHKCFFNANLNTPSAIQIQTPDGKRFACTILGLAFTDYASGHSELFAGVKDSIGRKK